MQNSVSAFYDELAAGYHFLFEDWQASLRRQGEVLDQLLRSRLGDRSLDILDCTCGIGTQAIGLALRGHRVRGRDLSPNAIERARREAEAFGVSIEFAVADLRTDGSTDPGAVDVVLACDNALPHLLLDEDLRIAVSNMASKLRPGGLFLASIRDYDEMLQQRARGTPVRVFDRKDGRNIVFQVWDWLEDGKTYCLNQFVLTGTGSDWQTACFTTKYRALLRSELDAAIVHAGLTDLRWQFPPASGYYQPLVSACKPGRAND
jgi:SAM-dependent methyltransferase